MAIVKVYNLDGTEYGTLDTKQYIFNNNLIGFEPVKLDTKIYPYVKINGQYYVNDGGEFFSKGQVDNSAGLMKMDDAFQMEGVSPNYKIHIGEDAIYNDPTFYSTTLKATSWDCYAKIPGYGVQNKALTGTFLVDKPTANYNYFYSGNFTRADGSAIDKPEYWTFIPGSPFIVYSNLDEVGPSNYTLEWETMPGSAKQPWWIEELGWLLNNKRDEVNRSTDNNTEWWTSHYNWLEITSTEADNDGTGHSYHDGYRYHWNQEFTKARSVKIQKYSSNTPSVNIELSSGSIGGVSGLIASGKKIVLVKRPLFNLQKLIDDNDLRRFMLIYGTSNQTDKDCKMVIATQDRPYVVPNRFPWGFRSKSGGRVNNADDFQWRMVGDNWSYGAWAKDGYSYYSFWPGSHIAKWGDYGSMWISLPSLEFYDVTTLITSTIDIQTLADNVSESNKINPIWKDEIVVQSDPQVVEFNFSKEEIVEKGLTHCHGGVSYTFYIDNIQSLRKPSLPETPSRYIDFWQHLMDKSHYRSGWSTISASWAFIDVFEWKTPRWFSDHFVDLGWTQWGLVYTGANDYDDYNDYYPIQVIENDGNSNDATSKWNSRRTDTEEDTGHKNFSCVGDVAGWSAILNTKWEHVAPIKTSYDEGNTSDIEGKYLSSVHFLHSNAYWGDEDGNSPCNYTEVSHSHMNGLGVQMGLTTGILINYPKNTVDSNGTIPRVSEHAVALIVCDEY